MKVFRGFCCACGILTWEDRVVSEDIRVLSFVSDCCPVCAEKDKKNHPWTSLSAHEMGAKRGWVWVKGWIQQYNGESAPKPADLAEVVYVNARLPDTSGKPLDSNGIPKLDAPSVRRPSRNKRPKKPAAARRAR